MQGTQTPPVLSQPLTDRSKGVSFCFAGRRMRGSRLTGGRPAKGGLKVSTLTLANASQGSRTAGISWTVEKKPKCVAAFLATVSLCQGTTHYCEGHYLFEAPAFRELPLEPLRLGYSIAPSLSMVLGGACRLGIRVQLSQISPEVAPENRAQTSVSALTLGLTLARFLRLVFRVFSGVGVSTHTLVV